MDITFFKRHLFSLSLICLCTHAVFSGTVNPSSVQTGRLRITNQCAEPIWIQQDFKSHTQDPIVVKIDKGAAYDYTIPDGGLPATRFWPKKSCNVYGYNCVVGESTGVPEAINSGQQSGAAMAPDINSKFEATWGCKNAIFDHNPSLCAANLSAPDQHLGPETWWNASAVDGYTLPYRINVKNDNQHCRDVHSGQVIQQPGVDCSGLDVNACPSDENLSTEGQFPVINGVNVTHVNLQWRQEGEALGCFSPCSKMTVAQGSDNGATNGGWRTLLGGLSPESPEAKMYCCPTPPVSPAECSAGPGARSAYVHSVQGTQHCNAYTYAYDDAKGLARCDAEAQFEVIFCPQASSGTSDQNSGGSGSTDTSGSGSPGATEPPRAPGYPLQFNFNTDFGIKAYVNDAEVANAQVWQSTTFPTQSILKAHQADKWGSCQLNIGTETVQRGTGELCNRLNIVKEGTGKVHIYLPADIPNNSVPNEIPSSPPSTPPETPPPSSPPAEHYVVFGMDASQWAKFKDNIVTNGSQIALGSLGQGNEIDLTVHQGGNVATCIIGRSGNSLNIVPSTGVLCQGGLVLVTQNGGDYYIGIPNPLPQNSGGSQKAFGLGIAQGMSVTVDGRTIRWDSPDKMVYLFEGVTNIGVLGNNGLTRTCPVTLSGGTLHWPGISECAGVVENSGVLYFPAF